MAFRISRSKSPWIGGYFIDSIRQRILSMGYQEVEIPVLMPAELFKQCTEGTENRMFALGKDLTLTPEVTNYIRSIGIQRLGAAKVMYVARCFRDESTTDATRLREFTQIGLEYLGPNPLDCCKVVRQDALRLFKRLLPQDGVWELQDNVQRGLNLYQGKTFEIQSTALSRQVLGGGAYDGGAGWALGLERLMAAQNP